MTSHSLVKFLGCAFFGMVFSLAPLASTPAAESTEFDPSTIIPQEFLGYFIRGDVYGNGTVDLTDAIGALKYMILGTLEASCEDAIDSNDDGQLTIDDPIHILTVLFLGGTSIPAPAGPRCGVDPTEGSLGCDIAVACVPVPAANNAQPVISTDDILLDGCNCEYHEAGGIHVFGPSHVCQ